MTREPDRFEAKAREVVAAFWPGKHARSQNVELVAAALRQAADEALERAAQEPPPRCAGCRRETEPVPDGIRNEARLYGHRWWCPACGQAVCAWWTSAAAPAVHKYDCPATHSDPFREDLCTCKPVAPSLLPRVLAFLEAHGASDALGFAQARNLAAELRRYIAETEGKT